MNSNTGNSILIFYGGAHLQDGYLPKQMPTLTDEENMGYWLAHYLKEKFGNNEILTINQAIVDLSRLSLTPLEKYKNVNILLESKFVPQWPRFDPQNFDMYILRHDVFVQQPHRINFIFSKRGIEKAIHRLGELENIGTGDATKREYDEITEKLFIITGQKFTHKDEVKSWFENNNFVGLKRFEQKEFADQIFEYYCSNTGNRRVQKILNELGFGPGVYGQATDTATYRKYENNLLHHLAYHNAESVFWLGYPDEKEEAKKNTNTI
ncbi:MAG TPA: hypothetical protein VGK25_08905 [Ignavibacteria bacterium]